MYKQYIQFFQGLTIFSCLVPISVQAQVTPDSTLPENSEVTPQGNVIQIDGGTTRGNNLFHSFSDFSVPAETQANFNNADTIENIFSRVTGGRESVIEGGIGTNGTANLFLINPAGIIFGQDAFLNVGGSFIGSTADSLLFPDGIEYSATSLDNPPVLTINAPVGLGFRDNPGDIVNSSIVTDDFGTPDDFDDDDLIGLRVFEDQTLALIGGDLLIEGGFLSTIGGRIELGSVAENSTVRITPINKGFNFTYEEASGFQDISLSTAAFVNNLGANTGNIEIQGSNVSLIEGSQIGIFAEFNTQSGNININASDSLRLDGNAAEIDLGNIETLIFHNVIDNSLVNDSSININSPELSISNGAQINSNTDLGSAQGVNINITAEEINLAGSFLDDDSNPIVSGIFSNVFEEGTGDGGDITIFTDNLNLNRGAQVTTATFGVGNAGNLTIGASESIELNGTISNSNIPSGLFANVEIPLFSIPRAGNAGNIKINTARFSVRDGAQVSTGTLNTGNGGILTIDASESIELSGFSPLAEFRREGISGIFVSARPSFIDEETGAIIPTTGNGGRLELTTRELTLEGGASISADTFSLGEGGSSNINTNTLTILGGSEIRAGSLLGADPVDNQRGTGGTININASDSIEVIGAGDINGISVNSSILTLAESNGDAGNASLTTSNLSVRDGGEINASADGTGAAGNLEVNASTVDLSNGSIVASTNNGTGGNINLTIAEDIELQENSFISAEAFNEANGGNLNIDSRFIIAYPDGNNDIFANAQQGIGGNININAESLFGIRERALSDSTNDINASSDFSLDGNITINTPDINPLQGATELPANVVEPGETTAQACRVNQETQEKNGLTVTGKGGIPPAPELALDSQAITINGENTEAVSTTPAPIETSQGKVKPARGIKVTESGEVILTAYRTNNSGERTPQIKRNCG